MADAAMRGHLGIVQFLHAYRSEGCTAAAAAESIKQGHDDTAVFLLEHRPEVSAVMALQAAVSSSHVGLVRWLHAHRPESFQPAVRAEAARLGRDEVMRFFVEGGLASDAARQ
ncbi:hypothetical protein BC831DRAFT_513910 [Entophlyctis helioformis]|nr:hypothetical protein BC831DRAFT_513910 [Entophlyctis helioformis]